MRQERKINPVIWGLAKKGNAGGGGGGGVLASSRATLLSFFLSGPGLQATGERISMVSHAPKTFSAVARLLQEHVKESEDRCSALEHQCRGPEFRASMKGEDSVAAARWWWREVTECIHYSHFDAFSM